MGSKLIRAADRRRRLRQPGVGRLSNWLAVHFNSPKIEDIRNVRVG